MLTSLRRAPALRDNELTLAVVAVLSHLDPKPHGVDDLATAEVPTKAGCPEVHALAEAPATAVAASTQVFIIINSRRCSNYDKQFEPEEILACGVQYTRSRLGSFFLRMIASTSRNASTGMQVWAGIGDEISPSPVFAMSFDTMNHTILPQLCQCKSRQHILECQITCRCQRFVRAL